MKASDKIKAAKAKKLSQKEEEIDALSVDQVKEELRQKKLQVFGTNQERKDRLKKYHGINNGGSEKPELIKKPSVSKANVVDKIKEMEDKRNERRKKMEEEKLVKKEKAAINEARGEGMIDIDFQTMMEKSRIAEDKAYPHVPLNYAKIYVTVRKRPLFPKEKIQGQIDCVSVANPIIRVGEPKYKVDGITKYIENHDHKFDNVFGDQHDNEDMYKASLQPMLDKLFNDGVVTIFAYGQTGSGKTFTMVALQNLAISDIYNLAENDYADLEPQISLSFYEIYSGRILDLLNNKKRLQVLEDGANKIQVKGLQEISVESVDELKDAIQFAHSVRTTHATQANDTSSRSHAICCINVRDGQGSMLGKFLMVDLAGSERAQDIRSNNRDRRSEGAEINKSLLALKECIRALDDAKGSKDTHVPFRASKLTMVLRDSFMGTKKNICIGMIACVSPGYSHADHSLNTIRYAERLKEFPTESQYAKLVENSGAQVPKPKPKAKAKPAPKPKPSAVSKENKPPKGGVVKVTKRAKWGKIDKTEYAEELKVEEDDNEEDQENLMRTKKGELEDWRLLKQTLRSGGEDDIQALDIQEKADMLMEKKEELISKHMKYIRQVALMLKQEGELITNVQKPDCDEEYYVKQMRQIVKQKLKIYQDLDRDLDEIENLQMEEEEAYNQVNKKR